MAKPKLLPELDTLREMFDLDPETGILLWRERPRAHFATQRAHRYWNGQYAGKPAGTLDSFGHTKVKVTLGGKTTPYLAHRIVWKMAKGTEPPPEIDHRNTAPSNNWIDNLRETDRSGNCWNRRVNQNSKTGLKGIRQVACGRYGARIQAGHKSRWLGTFDTAEEAVAAWTRAAQELHGEFWNPGNVTV